MCEAHERALQVCDANLNLGPRNCRPSSLPFATNKQNIQETGDDRHVSLLAVSIFAELKAE